MSYPLDVAAQNIALDALLSGDTSGLPTSWEVAGYSDDPRTGGVEVSGAGYARPVISADLTDWPAASAGAKTSATVPVADPSGAWTDTIRFWVLIDHADSTTRWFFGRLLEEVAVVTGTETDIAYQLTIFWSTEGF